MKFIAFCLVFALIFFSVEKIFYVQGRTVFSTWDDIQNPDTADPDILFMGNSHMFVSIIPDLINESCHIKTEIIGSSSQNMAMTVDNLKTILHYKTPHVIVLEVYCCLLDSRESLQDEKRGNMIDNYDGIRSYPDKFMGVSHAFTLDTIPEGMFQLCRPTNTWTRWKNLFSPSISISNDVNGYRERSAITLPSSDPGIAAEENKQNYNFSSPSPIPVYNEEALKEFLDITAAQNIPVYLYKNEISESRPEYIGMLQYVENIAAQYDNTVWLGDWTSDMKEIGLSRADFYDDSHLNRSGAVKNTLYMIEKLKHPLDLQPDFSNIFAYQSESVTELSDGSYRYSINNFSDCLFSFTVLEGKKEIIANKDFSEENYIDLPYLLSETQNIKVTMIPLFNDSPKEELTELTISFMKDGITKQAIVTP